MTDINNGGLDTVDSIIGDVSQDDSPSAENTDAILQNDATKPEGNEKEIPDQKPESKPEESDDDLIQKLKDNEVSLNKIERIQELVKQKNLAKEEVARQAKELEELRANKTAAPTENVETQQTKSEAFDEKSFSDSLGTALRDLPEPTFEPMFEYEVDENGKPIKYKNPSDEPQTLEQMAKVMYPQIEKNIIKRLGMLNKLENQKAESQASQEKAATDKVKQEIVDSFDGDEGGYKEYATILGEDYEAWKKDHPDQKFDVRQHLRIYLNRIYKKSPDVDKDNIETANKVTTRSRKDSTRNEGLMPDGADPLEYVMHG